jgi:hypothetical protein
VISGADRLPDAVGQVWSSLPGSLLYISVCIE